MLLGALDQITQALTSAPMQMLALFGIVITIIGWLVVIRNSTKLARRAEVNALISDIIRTTQTLRKDTIEAWNVAASTDTLPEHADYLLSGWCSDIEHSLAVLKDYYFDHKLGHSQIARLRILAQMPEWYLEQYDLYNRIGDLQHTISDILFAIRTESQAYVGNHKRQLA